MKVLRTFHIPTLNNCVSLNITETLQPETVCICLGCDDVMMSREQLLALQGVLYDIRWEQETPAE